MKNRRYIKVIRNRIILLTAFLILVCISFSTSYSNFIYKSSNHRAVEMYVNKLDYELKINDSYTDNISVKPGNTIVNVNVSSNNDVETNFKLSYKNDNDINVFYLGNKPSGNILSNEAKSYKLFISNLSDKLINVKFEISSGYINNSLDDIKVSEDHTEINNTLSLGDYVNYIPANENSSYLLEKRLSGYSKDQNIIKKNSKWRILEVNDDASITVISEAPITIDNKNNLLFLSGSQGYNNGVYLLNDICNELYGGYNVTTRNLNISDIEKYLSNIWSYKEYYNPQTENGYIKYDNNTFTPKQYLNNLSKNESGMLIEEESFVKQDSLEINVDYWTHEMEENNFENGYYELFMNGKYNTWLSSRYVNAFDTYALFGLSNIYSNVVSGNILYSSMGSVFSNSNAIRPVVVIKNPLYLEKGIINLK